MVDLSRETVPIGEVSVMPQACRIGRPRSFSKLSTRVCEAAAPPTKIVFRLERSYVRPFSSLRYW